MSVNEVSWQRLGVFLQCLAMPALKNAPLAFRVPAELKRELQQIADREARSISQICEILLRIGAEQYGKEGARFLHRFLDRRKTDG